MIRKNEGLRILLTLILLLLFLIASILWLPHSQVVVNWRFLEGDLNGNGTKEVYSLVGQRVTVTENGRTLWVSPQTFDIDAFALGDINNDGKSDLVISLWKKGSFGDIRPFWHTGRDDDYKNHLFLYGFEGNTLKQIWCSSNLDRPLLSFAISDIDGDGLNELVAEEGKYIKKSGSFYAADPNAAPKTAVWQWDEWGFRWKV